MNRKIDKFVRLNDRDMLLGGLLAREIPKGQTMINCPATEMLSEFIDGKLPYGNRESVVAHLGDCVECYSVVSESLTIREELISRSRARTRKVLSYATRTALAAAAVLLIVFRMLQPADDLTGKPERELAYREAPIENKSMPKQNIALSTRSFAGELADRLAENNSIASLTRRTGISPKPDTAYGFSSVVSLEKAAFRIGMCLADLEVALKAKDQNKIELFAKKLIELLKPMEASYGLIPSIIGQRGTTGNSGKEASRYDGFSRAVEALFENKREAVFLKFGEWVEAVSLAAEDRDASFLQPAVVKEFRKELEKSGVPVGTLKNLSQLEAIMSSDGIQKDQFKTMARLLADIKDMF